MDPRERLLSLLRLKPHLIALEEGDSFLRSDLGRSELAQMGLTVQLSLWGTGKYQMVFWFKPSDHLQDEQTLFSQKPEGIFYREIPQSTHELATGRGHFILSALLKLINNTNLNRLIQLDFREWDSFLREKNSEALVEDMLLWKEIFFHLKIQIIHQLSMRFLSVKELSFQRQNPESLNYQEKNLFLLEILSAFHQLFPHDQYPLTAVEATDSDYQVKWKRKLNESEELIFEELLCKNFVTAALFPVKLVAVN
jgi:hypothetical protein